MIQSKLKLENDFDYLLGFLPQAWQLQAKNLGVLTRCRKVPDAEKLLRVLLIHLSEGCSLRETSLRARKGHIIDISDVAIMDRLKKSAEWFRWMSTELMMQWILQQPTSIFGSQWNIRLVDGTRIKEPGPTGSSWFVHYSIGLPSLQCHELLVCDPRGKGESFERFHVNSGDLFVGDRVYGVRPSIFHVKRNNGEVLVRFALGNLPLHTPAGKRFYLIRQLRNLKPCEIGDWDVIIQN